MIALPMRPGMFANGRRWRVHAIGREDLTVDLSGPTTIMVPLMPGEGMFLQYTPL